MVSRFNLLFEMEDPDKLEKRKELAREQQATSSMIMKFHYMVDQTKVQGKETLSDKIKTQISYRILNYNSYQKYVQQL